MTTTPDDAQSARQARRDALHDLIARVGRGRAGADIGTLIAGHLGAEQADGDQAREQLAIVIRERDAHEEHRRQLADALGEPEHADWTALSARARQFVAARATWKRKAAEQEQAAIDAACEAQGERKRAERVEADHEAHRLALSEALSLGTSAPWDAITEGAQELQAALDRVQAAANSLADGTDTGFRAALTIRDALDGEQLATEPCSARRGPCLCGRHPDPGICPGTCLTGLPPGGHCRCACESAQGQPHRYLSTGCLHGHHGYCKATTGCRGAKSPGQCKFCAAPCICRCHRAHPEPLPECGHQSWERLQPPTMPDDIPGPRVCIDCGTLLPATTAAVQRTAAHAAPGAGMTSMKADLIAFLRARLVEDAQLAAAASPGPWRLDAEADEVLAVDGITVADVFALSGTQLRATASHIAAHHPARVLRAIEAKQELLELHHIVHRQIGWLDDGEEHGGEIPVCAHCVPRHAHFANRQAVPEGPCHTLRLLASEFADHPDYRQEWRP